MVSVALTDHYSIATQFYDKTSLVSAAAIPATILKDITAMASPLHYMYHRHVTCYIKRQSRSEHRLIVSFIKDTLLAITIAK